MAVFNFKPSSSVKCTASLVSPSWLVSAAHCLVAKHHFTQSSPCLSELPDTGLDIVCEKAGNGDIIVNFPSQVPTLALNLYVPSLPYFCLGYRADIRGAARC